MDLADRFPGRVWILPFNKYRESQYGADWAWAFENADGSQTLPMLVQAKVLDLNDHEYPEINRTIGKSSIRQIDRLIDTAVSWGWPALYAFYNHLDDGTRIPPNCRTLSIAGNAPIHVSWGVSIADAHRVRAALNDQTFHRHRQHSRPLHCLLCSGGRGARHASGSPAMALDGLKALRQIEPRPRDGEYPLLPDAPLKALPELFQKAKEAQEGTAKDAQLDRLAREFPNLAGVVVLRDANTSAL